MNALAPPANITDRPPVIGFRLDGAGRGERLHLEECNGAHSGAGGFTWVHVYLDDGPGERWLNEADLEPEVLSAIAADETRPRCTVHGEGVLLNLRGVNLNPGAEPEDMISIRLWVEKDRVISVWLRPLFAIQDVFDAIGRHQAPTTPGELVARLSLRLADRAEPTVAALNEQIDDLEDQALEQDEPVSRRELSDIRLTAILLRRYMFPQRDALSTFEIEDMEWLTAHDRSRVREAADRVTRLAEDLDAIRDRAQVVHEQIMDQRAEIMNNQMLVLSIVAAIFLPLGLVTGLLGINVGGIPGTDNPYAFWVVTGLLVVIGLFQVWLFRKLMLRR